MCLRIQRQGIGGSRLPSFSLLWLRLPPQKSHFAGGPNRQASRTMRRSRACVGGVPVYSFGNLVYVYGQSPDCCPGVDDPAGNTESGG